MTWAALRVVRIFYCGRCRPVFCAHFVIPSDYAAWTRDTAVQAELVLLDCVYQASTVRLGEGGGERRMGAVRLFPWARGDTQQRLSALG